MSTHDASAGASQTPRVIIEDPPRMNLLGLMLGSLVERNARREDLARLLSALNGSVMVQAGEMHVTLAFDQGTLTITRRIPDRPSAMVSGSMDSLLGLALGRGLVGAYLSGRLKAKGNLFFLLKMRPLLVAS